MIGAIGSYYAGCGIVGIIGFSTLGMISLIYLIAIQALSSRKTKQRLPPPDPVVPLVKTPEWASHTFATATIEDVFHDTEPLTTAEDVFYDTRREEEIVKDVVEQLSRIAKGIVEKREVEKREVEFLLNSRLPAVPYYGGGIPHKIALAQPGLRLIEQHHKTYLPNVIDSFLNDLYEELHPFSSIIEIMGSIQWNDPETQQRVLVPCIGRFIYDKFFYPPLQSPITHSTLRTLWIDAHRLFSFVRHPYSNDSENLPHATLLSTALIDATKKAVSDLLLEDSEYQVAFYHWPDTKEPHRSLIQQLLDPMRDLSGLRQIYIPHVFQEETIEPYTSSSLYRADIVTANSPDSFQPDDPPSLMERLQEMAQWGNSLFTYLKKAASGDEDESLQD
jgi:hypothetical protein